MAVPILDDFQLQFGDTGVLLNADNGLSPFVDVDTVAGLDSATFRTSSKDIEGIDGSIIEAEYESKRTITITGTVFGITYEQMESYVDSLKQNLAPSSTDKPLYFKAPGVAQRVVYGKCTSGFRSNWDSMRRMAMAAFTFTIECGDPIIYGSDELQFPGQIITQPIPGFSFNFSFNFDFGAVAPGVTGAMNVSHNGNRPAPFIATFTGSGVTTPGLLHEGLGRQVTFDVPLNMGDQLVVDFRKRSVLLNGSPRRGSVTREGWFLLQEQTVNPLRLLTGSGSLQVTLSTHDAWR
jgi:phage-related protein